MKTMPEVKEEFRRKGITVTAWARLNGFGVASVHRVMSGKSKCYRGKAHKIAVMLGLKDGEIAEV